MASRRRCCCKGTTICVKVCTTVAVVGATVAIYTGSTLIASCVTGSNGCCTIDASGTYTLEVTYDSTLIYSASRTLNGTQINLSIAASAFTGTPSICCGAYFVPESFTLTDADGSLAFDLDSGSSPPAWYGGHAVTQTSCTVTTPGGICVAAVPSSGPVRVCYQMTCNAGSSPVFAFQRRGPGCTNQAHRPPRRSGTRTPPVSRRASNAPRGLPQPAERRILISRPIRRIRRRAGRSPSLSRRSQQEAIIRAILSVARWRSRELRPLPVPADLFPV